MHTLHFKASLGGLALATLFIFGGAACGGSAGRHTASAKDDPSTGAKDESASLAGTPSPDKEVTEESAPPSSRSDSFIDQTVAAHNGPAKYWHDQTGLGQGNNMTWTYVNGGSISNSMFWESKQPAGRYEVQAFIPRNYATTRSAKYRIIDGLFTLSTVTIDQNSKSDVWVPLGTFDFTHTPNVLLGDDTGESYSSTKRKIGFDAIRFLDKGSPSGGGGGGGGSNGGGGSITVPEYRQTNKDWSSKLMKPSSCTMGSYGCLVTSLASVSCWAGYATDPGKFCDWLSSNRGFDKQGYWLNDGNLSNYTGSRVRVAGSKPEWEGKPADLKVATAEIDAGRPIILKVHYKNTTSNSAQHWVVAYAYTRNASGGVDDFKIMDPAGLSGGSLKYFYFGSTFEKRIYNAKLIAK